MSALIAPTDPFLGTWVLVPEACDYARGEPPRSGTYMLHTPDGVQYHFDMAWVDAAGEAHRASFGAVPDGAPHPFAAPGVDTMTLTRVDAVNLVSEVFHRGMLILTAVRTLSEDGRALRVAQSGQNAEGEVWENVALYRRA